MFCSTRKTKLISQIFSYFLLGIVLIHGINADIFTSLEQMTTLVKTQADVTKYLKEFLDYQQSQVDKAKASLNEFEQVAQDAKMLGNPEIYVGNPVNAFILIKKLTKDLQKFIDTVNQIDQLKSMVSKIKEDFNLPTNEDYEGAIAALHRLEDTYALTTKDIRTGNMSKKHPSKPLTAFDCFELGRIAYNNKDYYHTIRWMNESLVQVGLEGDRPTVNIIEVLDYYAFATGEQGNINDAIELTKRILEIDPTHERSLSNLDFYKRKLKEIVNSLKRDNGEENEEGVTNNPFEFKNPRLPSVLGYERDTYEALCRGEKFKISPKRLSKLKCRYLNNSPLLLIGPIKEEQVFDDPAIWQYHDVITEKQLNIMKTLAYPKLKRAIVRSPITGQYETADYRISKSGWLRDLEHPVLPFLTALVSNITKLNLQTAEEWQIANYGIGGQYDPHFDFARKSDPGTAFDHSIGNRIATWLFYLEVPEVGGDTVFPIVGARVKATRRSAAFWYNLFPSGDGDFRTRHAACPVLYGTKWVSNKWIHIVGQEFIRPCNLKQDEHNDF